MCIFHQINFGETIYKLSLIILFEQVPTFANSYRPKMLGYILINLLNLINHFRGHPTWGDGGSYPAYGWQLLRTSGTGFEPFKNIYLVIQNVPKTLSFLCCVFSATFTAITYKEHVYTQFYCHKNWTFSCLSSWRHFFNIDPGHFFNMGTFSTWSWALF